VKRRRASCITLFIRRRGWCKRAYDESGNTVEEVHLDDKEKPTRSPDGYATVKRAFDRHRNNVEERYFDEQGKAFLMKGTYARIAKRYDDHNALLEVAYFGAGGKPAANDGWARITYAPNVDGQNVEYFGLNGNKMTRRYDKRKALVEEAYFGVSGEPVLSDEGSARITYVNDERGRPIEWAHFGVRGEPVIGKSVPSHRVKGVLDEQGRFLEVSLFGTDGKPQVLAFGEGRRRCARLVLRYGAEREVTSRDCFDALGTPVP
jgi:hypothetical protein